MSDLPSTGRPRASPGRSKYAVERQLLSSPGIRAQIWPSTVNGRTWAIPTGDSLQGERPVLAQADVHATVAEWLE
jgi:hypothetical protein